MNCDGCKKYYPGDAVGAFHIERTNHSVTFSLCELCAKKVEYHIIWRLTP